MIIEFGSLIKNISNPFHSSKVENCGHHVPAPPLTGHADLVVVDVVGVGDQDAGALRPGRLPGEVAGG